MREKNKKKELFTEIRFAQSIEMEENQMKRKRKRAARLLFFTENVLSEIEIEKTRRS